MTRAGARLAIAALALSAAAPATAKAACDDLLPMASPAAPAGQPLTGRALIGLRDMGAMGLHGFSAGAFAVSPEGRRVAFALRRADPDANTFCVGLVVIALDNPTHPVLVDKGGELVRLSEDNRGIAALGSGFPTLIVPKWSPDGQAIAYLRADRGSIQVWQAAADGSGARQVSFAPSEVTDFTWTPDSRALIFAWQPALAAYPESLVREARTGFVYDARFWPIDDNRPHPLAPLARQLDVARIDGAGAVRSATSVETLLLDVPDTKRPDTARLFARTPDNRFRAWTQTGATVSGRATVDLRIRTDDRETVCTATACRSGIIGLWWVGSTLVFIREERERPKGEFAMYRMAVDGVPQLIERTLDVWSGCAVAHKLLVCGREGSRQPRRLVTIGAVDGASKPLFDPNPGFSALSLGSVERLAWHAPGGNSDFGDLVLPPGHRPGDRHPLIVVQYHSQGFLRGGTGDEYPIQLLAQAGYAVLVFEMNPVERRMPPADTALGGMRAEMQGSNLRFALLHAVEAGVRAVIARGVIDPDRIGITGLSDGAATVCFALVHSKLFKAAAMSSGCNDPVTMMAMVGPAQTALMEALGVPHPGLDQDGFWKANSLALNADRISAPLLVQAADSEFRLSFEAFAAFRARNRPIELIVFPDEFHVKYQPVHRLAIYQRNIDWFDFWLRGIENPTSDPAQYIRWRALRAAAASGPSAKLEAPDARFKDGVQGTAGGTGMPRPDQASSQASTSASINKR